MYKKLELKIIKLKKIYINKINIKIKIFIFNNIKKYYLIVTTKLIIIMKNF